ncbi:MAG: COX15/CtaA family protein [Gammaproteobacteria bacterium]|nr:COX15/CtaA family protein [Gammaproteobacteria bacterium]
MQRASVFQLLSGVALALGFLVVILGAYTRLSDAGLGCPDWPGCYGRISVPEAAQEIDRANTLYPDRPLHPGKARREMVHRYVAGALGLAVLALAWLAWARRRATVQPVTVPVFLLALVVFQAALGMWTVTWLLKPIVVTAHLLGGMAILALLFWLVLEQFPPWQTSDHRSLWPWAVAAILVLAAQIFLGGWTSANYAALICPEFPACRDGNWWPAPDFAEGFVFWRGLGIDYEGGVLGVEARTAVHLAHRVGAIVTAVVLAIVAARALREPAVQLRVTGYVMLALLLAQIGLGIASVLMVRPLPVAVAHNAGAALLLLSAIALLHGAPRRHQQT